MRASILLALLLVLSLVHVALADRSEQSISVDVVLETEEDEEDKPPDDPPSSADATDEKKMLKTLEDGVEKGNTQEIDKAAEESTAIEKHEKQEDAAQAETKAEPKQDQPAAQHKVQEAQGGEKDDNLHSEDTLNELITKIGQPKGGIRDGVVGRDVATAWEDAQDAEESADEWVVESKEVLEKGRAMQRKATEMRKELAKSNQLVEAANKQPVDEALVKEQKALGIEEEVASPEANATAKADEPPNAAEAKVA